MCCVTGIQRMPSAWIAGMKWIGPVEIPQDRVDYSDEESWAAKTDKKRVKHFARRLEAGDQLHPRGRGAEAR